jgi:hypothetical protein
MKISYIGPHDAVVVPLPLGGEKVVQRNGVLDTSEAHAKGLLEQILNWAPVAKKEKVAEPTPEVAPEPLNNTEDK